jgi:integrative and conjugative element protein (TIGR02256 family)
MHTKVTWIHSRVRQSLVREADQHFPYETGGVLIGYWADIETTVVTRIVGAGPASEHRRHAYGHDHEWEAAEIARYYNLSNGTDTYLGDWHTHPGASAGHLSFADRRSLRSVIAAPAAQTTRPIMLIAFGQPALWTIAIWQAELRPRVLFGQRLAVHPVRPIAYDDSDQSMTATST